MQSIHSFYFGQSKHLARDIRGKTNALRDPTPQNELKVEQNNRKAQGKKRSERRGS